VQTRVDSDRARARRVAEHIDAALCYQIKLNSAPPEIRLPRREIEAEGPWSSDNLRTAAPASREHAMMAAPPVKVDPEVFVPPPARPGCDCRESPPAPHSRAERSVSLPPATLDRGPRSR